ncbi:MAG TPA: hypothetical protein VKB18_03110 [Gemmatimonadota bacterium]|nr:hypothetical protein [Gemmatimonadota bacterium]
MLEVDLMPEWPGREAAPGPEAEAGDEAERQRPQITHHWIRTAIQAGRQAFEREMRRDRRALDAEFDRFWKEQGAR